MFLGCWAHIGCGYNSTKTPRRGNSLKTRNANAHNKNTCCGYGASCRHHHWKRAAIKSAGINYSAITCKICLRRQNIHRLSTCNAWHQLHGKTRQACIRLCFKCHLIPIRIHNCKNACTFFNELEFSISWSAHLKH